jgi:hypothetical protein
MSTLPDESSAARTSVAVAVHGPLSTKQSAWKSFGGGSAVNCVNCRAEDGRAARAVVRVELVDARDQPRLVAHDAVARPQAGGAGGGDADRDRPGERHVVTVGRKTASVSGT